MNNGRDCEHGQLARSCDRCADAAEIAELRKDAERYRWLREQCSHKGTEGSRIAANEYGMDWDAAIDAAMALHNAI